MPAYPGGSITMIAEAPRRMTASILPARLDALVNFSPPHADLPSAFSGSPRIITTTAPSKRSSAAKLL
ncbi:MAG: hypothetical protein ACK5C3_05255 [bacterium]